MPTPIASGSPQSGEVTLQEKIGHLGRPGSYPELTSRVEVVETHMSVVFLTDRHVYKLKKPVRYDFLDFSTLEARRFDCLEEVRLNRRLAPGVYLDVVPLAATAAGLVLEGAGPAADWLVKMRRLPREGMLDHAIASGRVSMQDVERCIGVLCDFYRHAPPAATSPVDYLGRLARDITAHRRELLQPRYGMPQHTVAAVAARLAGFVRQHLTMLESRVASGRVIEGHGDLRPEHVCLAPEPLFIDCLEFSRELRTLDTADEVAYLALECDCAGAPGVASTVLAAYRRSAHDEVDAKLIAFYQSQRALLRAKISAWHLDDGLRPEARSRWLQRAGRYLAYAEERSTAAYR